MDPCTESLPRGLGKDGNQLRFFEGAVRMSNFDPHQLQLISKWSAGNSDLPWSPASHSLVCRQLDFSENRIIFSCMLRQKFCGDLAFKKGCRPHLKRKCRCNAKTFWVIFKINNLFLSIGNRFTLSKETVIHLELSIYTM